MMLQKHFVLPSSAVLLKRTPHGTSDWYTISATRTVMSSDKRFNDSRGPPLIRRPPRNLTAFVGGERDVISLVNHDVLYRHILFIRLIIIAVAVAVAVAIA